MKTIKNFLIVFIIFFLLAETVSRFYWKLEFDVPFFSTSKMVYAFYPALKNVEQETKDHDNYFDLLILDASTLGTTWGTVEQALKDSLAGKTVKPLRVFNLSAAGHTIIDSYYKYRFLPGTAFDAVILYHGINESRANNCPDEIFRNNFSHYVWYRQLAALDQHPEISISVLPYTLHFISIRIKEYFGIEKFVSQYGVREEWKRFGNKIKTRKTFEGYLEKIVSIARDKKEKIMLTTLAFYIPENYSIEKFQAKSLDYDAHLSPVEMWGNPADVRACMEAHNEIIKEIAARNPEILFIDIHAIIMPGKQCFNDVCHFTGYGSALFAHAVLPGLISAGN